MEVHNSARDRRRQPAARREETPPIGKTGAEFPGFLTEAFMSAWTCSLGWFRFTVSDSTAGSQKMYRESFRVASTTLSIHPLVL